MTWPPHEVRPLDLETFDERFRRYRLISPADQKQMASSLLRDGQLSPVVVCQLDQAHVLIDGFKRLAAARTLRGFSTLSARCLQADGQHAKAAIYRLNLVGRAPQELEEAWPCLNHWASVGSRGRSLPGRRGVVVGASQELGLPASGIAGEAV